VVSVEQPTTAVRASYIACDRRTDTERALPRLIWRRDDDGARVTRSAAIAGGPAQRLAASSTMRPEPRPLPPAAAVVATRRRRRRRHYHFARVLLRGGRCNAPVDDRSGSTTRVFSHGRNKETRARRLRADLSHGRYHRDVEKILRLRRGRRKGHTRGGAYRGRVTGTAVAVRDKHFDGGGL